jgi:YidC/Oxa1 family membrane protein insertase
MLPPEIQRIVLLIALAATGYLMILAWNDDMQQAKTPVAVSEAPLSSATGSVNAPDIGSGAVETMANADLPQVQSAPASAASGDVPDASMVVGSTPPTQAAVTPSPSNTSLVRVVTPTLKVWIDLVGGDIARVQLPAFPVDLEHPENAFLLLDHSAVHTYIAQSGLIGPDGPDSQAQRPTYTATASEVTLKPGEEREVVLSARVEGATVRKVFRFRADDYLVDVEYELINDSDQAKQAAMFAQIKRDTRPPADQDTFALAPRPYLGAAFTFPDERYRKVDFEDIDDDGPVDQTVTGGWVAFLQHYFLSAWVAPAEQTNRFSARRSNDGTYLFGFTGPLQQVAPGESGRWRAQFYAGPKDQKRLEEIAENLNLTVDYGFLWWIAVPLFYLLDWLYGMVGNWGVAIILLTVVVKAALYPLSAAGYKSMANMRRVAPAMKKLQERYANDREKLSREMMALYKKEGANPLGGCLPMLLPMPIFIALYWVLFESVELRQAPFFLWINDLSVMDPFFILPLLMGASMYWMQSLNPQVGDPMQVKMMKMMPIMFTVLFLFFPAGLVLYWLVNNVLSIAQQQYVYRQAEKAQAAKT